MGVRRAPEEFVIIVPDVSVLPTRPAAAEAARLPHPAGLPLPLPPLRAVVL